MTALLTALLAAWRTVHCGKQLWQMQDLQRRDGCVVPPLAGRDAALSRAPRTGRPDRGMRGRLVLQAAPQLCPTAEVCM